MDRESIETTDIKISDKMFRPSLNGTTPITKKTWLHPEDDNYQGINNTLMTASEDILILDNSMIELTNKLNELTETTTLRLNNVKDKLIHEKERLQDIIIMCNKYTDFENSIKLTDKDFDGNFTYNNGVFSCYTLSQDNVRYNIKDITGNGYVGNKYVWDMREQKYLKDSLDTSDTKSLKDNSYATFWEYSRLTANDTEEYVVPEINFDSEEAKCTLFVEVEGDANEIVINSEDEDIILADIHTSNNNKDFTDIGLEAIPINKQEESYNNSEYVFTSGKVACKPSKFFKLTFESNGYKDETIAFDRQKILADNDKEITEKVFTPIETAKRHVIRLNDLYFKKAKYSSEAQFTSRELVTDQPVSIISLFCNTYLPEGLDEKCIKFIMTVNGVDYEIKPVNSHLDGTKIIRFSQGTMKSDYSVYLNEKIKSAKLKVILNSKHGLSPFVNNLKVLVGDIV